MAWRTTGDVTEFLAAAGGYLRAERARNTVLLTVTENLRAGQVHRAGAAASGPAARPLFGWWTARPGHADRAGPAAGAFMHTPPFPVLVTAVAPDVARDLAGVLAGRPLSGVNAYPEVADAFAAAWRDAAGCGVDVHRRQRLYRLAGLRWPDPAPQGGHRLAAAGDVPLIAAWFRAFTREADDMDGGVVDQAAVVTGRVGYGGIMVWERDGEPVSVAGVTRRVAGMVRVGPVYTPPELRGHGYASGVTAAVSQAAIDAGAEEVLLYTDLANPVSNSIYRRIGYRPVEDRVVLAFIE